MSPKGAYHHGRLREALVEAALEAVAEGGVASVSMADAARRAGVSPAAPYRHFAGRQALLLATAVDTARALADRLERAGGGGRRSAPAEALAACAEAYTLFYLERGAGLDLVYLAELRTLRDAELAGAGRRVMDCVLPVAREIAGSADGAIVLLEQVFAVAHGYAQLRDVSLSSRRLRSPAAVARAAGAAVRLLAAATADPAVTVGA
ncbi:TetR/AcrR family transcriptional regulator [Nocardioides sp. T2.26MG-1]|uniref:TetR/AcrR family transcriptional regulator n=1 Tax=Nocardioides sp. T2.26MG-1 TaxID=3041166 RepID=UPI0024775310|nr:TetR/AcrR family transcriptional regulator [Nocardioides sp. T2.26MG-1]CAI9405247.1 HTH-type transcriptional regulator BetI [Nocardioides sp. T2.26MG-1]